MKQKELTTSFTMISNQKKFFGLSVCIKIFERFNPLKPKFTIVISIHYKAANFCCNSRLVVDEDDLMWFKNSSKFPCIGKPVS